jgi:hypothetical protein
MKTPASELEKTMFLHAGHALSAIQHLEDAICHTIVIKTTSREQITEAKNSLKEKRLDTLGTLINTAEQQGSFSSALLSKLKEFKKERNWFVHKSIAHNRDDWDRGVNREDLIIRISRVATQAQDLQLLVEGELFAYVEAQGMDTAHIKEKQRAFYNNPPEEI